MEETEKLLGRPFSIIQKVSRGKMLGRRISFPTINQQVDPEKLLPRNGVYISRVKIGDDDYYGVTSYIYDGQLQIPECLSGRQALQQFFPGSCEQEAWP